MNVDQNLLFGVLALQIDLVDIRQFLEACALWATRNESLLVDLMLERGWIEQADKEHLDYFVKRKIQRLDGDGGRGLEGKCEEVKRSLAAINGTDIQESPAGSCDADSPPMTLTADFCQPTNDRYELRRLHAQGGIGRIWLAHDTHLDRTVALKELRSERSNSPRAVARFVREAQITGQLQHPGITPIYDLGRHRAKDAPFYTMRFVEGTTLSDAVSAYHERRKCGEAEATDLLDMLNAFVAVCKTIAYGHSNGVLHRDVKSQNVVLGGFGEVIVLDWGLAKNLQDSEGERIEPAPFVADAELSDGALTVQGQTLGTPAYMSPEQAAGRLDDIDHRTDVYGLGAMLYEILTGQPPFSGVDTTGTTG